MDFFHIGEGVFVMKALFPHKVSMKKIFIIIIFVVSSVYLIADDIDAIYDPIITPIYTGRTLFCSVMTDDIDKTPCDPESRHIVYSTNVIDTIQGVMSFWIHFDTINLEPNKELTVKEITSLQFIRCDKPEFDISTLLPEFYEELHLWHWWLGDYVNPLTMYPKQQWTAKFIVIPQ